MDALWHLVFMDGRHVAAQSPVSFFEALREGEPNAPADLGHYLDRLRSRGAIGFGVNLDVGSPGAGLDARCVHALSSLISHGWVRPSARGAFADHVPTDGAEDALDVLDPWP
jgi:hypothetical protein